MVGCTPEKRGYAPTTRETAQSYEWDEYEAIKAYVCRVKERLATKEQTPWKKPQTHTANRYHPPNQPPLHSRASHQSLSNPRAIFAQAVERSPTKHPVASARPGHRTLGGAGQVAITPGSAPVAASGCVRDVVGACGPAETGRWRGCAHLVPNLTCNTIVSVEFV